MDFFSVQETFKKMFPEKLKTFTFDEKCIRICECIMTDGLPNISHHIEYDKVKVTVEGMIDQYVSIMPHRDTISWSSYKQMISSFNDVYLHPDTIKMLREAKDPQEYKTMISDYSILSGMNQDQIESKLK